jgi:hypothetical protein
LVGSATQTVECHTSFVDGGATASDLCAGALPVTTSGSVNVNLVGSYTLHYTATDPSGNVGSTTRTVNVVDTIPPVLTLLGTNPMTIQCDSAFVDPGATASDTCAGNLTGAIVVTGIVNANAAGSYTLTYSVSDGYNLTSLTRTVLVVDTTPPSIVCPADITVPNATGPVPVTYTVTATDTCSSVAVTCNPASGSLFPIGSTVVKCSATDGAGNIATCNFKVTVRQALSVTCPANVVVGTDPGKCSAVVKYRVPSASNTKAAVGCSPPSGSTFAKGTTLVTCTATDSSGDVATCGFTVTVQDKQVPVMTCPSNITATASKPNCTAVVNFPLPNATDNCGVGSVSCTPPSGSTFPKGKTAVACLATDTSGNTANCSFTVTVNCK